MSDRVASGLLLAGLAVLVWIIGADRAEARDFARWELEVAS